MVDAVAKLSNSDLSTCRLWHRPIVGYNAVHMSVAASRNSIHRGIELHKYAAIFLPEVTSSRLLDDPTR